MYPLIESSKIIKELGLESQLIKLPPQDERTRNVIYFLFDNGELVYIGKSQKFEIYNRVKAHRKAGRIFNEVCILPITGNDVNNIIKIEESIINSTKTRYNKHRPKKQSTLHSSRKWIREYVSSKKCNTTSFKIQKIK